MRRAKASLTNCRGAERTRRLHHPLLAQPPAVRLAVAEALEDAVGVLAEARQRARRIAGLVAEFHRRAQLFHPVGPGVYGVAAASGKFFHKHPRHLTARESALLAAVLPNPRRLSAARPSAYVERRAVRIRREVRNLGGPAYLPWLDAR